MDFDEYDYLERAVEQGGELELPLPAPPPPPKRKPDGVEEDPDGDGEGERGERRSKSLRRSHPDRGSGNGRHDDKPARGEREKDKSSRDKDKDSSRDKDRDKERERHRDRDRDRHRERSKDREREKDRDRDRERERERDRDIDREREKEKVSSREKDRAVSRDRREKETEHRDSLRDKETRHDSSRPSRDRKEKKEESIPKDPEADLERDQRTVFAYQICLKADERDVYDFFSKAGKVRDVRLIMDRSSRRSKGVGYIEFYDAMSVPMAIALSGQLLQGQPVMVKPSEAEKNLVQSTASTAGGANATIGPYSGGARRLYAGNLPSNITENQLRQVFEPFGSVELVQLPPDLETGLCKGFGFIQYARLEDARSAQQALDGVLELAGRVIKVSAMTDQTGIQDTLVGPGELDDDDGGGLSLTARSRALLMQKLDRSGTVTSTTAATLATNPSHGLLGEVVPSVSNIVSPLVSGISPAVLPGLAGIPNTALTAMEAIGAPTDCLLLKNMFNPKTETDPDFDLDIKDDVLQECSKFGVVKHIFVDKNSAGHVYLRFDSPSASLNAQRSLHGRWFAGMMITTQFWTPKAYEAKFPDGR